MNDSYRRPGLRGALTLGAVGVLMVGVVAPVQAGRKQTIEFEAFADMAVNESADLVARATSGLPVAFTSDTPGVCVVQDGAVFARQVGTCRVTASQQGNASWDPAEPVRRSADISKGEVKQAITTRDLTTSIDEPTDFAFGIRPYTVWDDQVLPTGTYGVQIAKENGEPVVRVDRPFDVETGIGEYSFNNPPRGLAPGWYIAFGCYNGDANYIGVGEDCGGMGRPFQKYLTPSRLTLALAPSPARFEESVDATVTVTGPDGKPVSAPNAVADVQWPTPDGEPWGVEVPAEDGTATARIDDLAFGNDVPVFAQYTDPSSEHGISWARVFIDVRKGVQRLTLAPLYDLQPGQSQALVVDSNSDQPIEVHSEKPQVCEVTDSQVTALTKGACAVTATQAGSEEWEDAEPVTRRFDVVKQVAYLSYPDGRTTVGQELAPLRPQYSDLSGDVRFAAAGLPDGTTMDRRTGVVSGTPTHATTGPQPVSVIARDDSGTEAGASFTIDVVPLPYPPRVAYPAGRGRVDQSLATLKPQMSGFDGPVRFRVDRPDEPNPHPAGGMPPGLSLDSRTGVISGTPLRAGTFTLDVVATDGTSIVAAQIRIVIRSGPLKPRLRYPTPVRSVVGVPMDPVRPQVVGLDHTPRVTVTGLPRGVEASKRGVLRGTPTTHGSFTVRAIARAKGKSAKDRFTVRVRRSPIVPSLSYPDVRVGVGQRLAVVRPAVAGVTGPLRFRARKLPPGLSVNRTTGALKGRPTAVGVTRMRVAVHGADGSARTRLMVEVVRR